MPLTPHFLRILSLVCMAGLFCACDGSNPSRNIPPADPVLAKAPLTRADSTVPVFDLAALVNLRANQIRARLGKPLSDQQESDNEQMKSMFYKQRGYELSIDYEVQSQRLLQLQLSTGDKPWKKLNDYLRAGHVSQTDKHYTLSLLNEEAGLLQGIDVTPDSARVMDRFGHWVIQR